MTNKELQSKNSGAWKIKRNPIQEIRELAYEGGLPTSQKQKVMKWNA